MKFCTTIAVLLTAVLAIACGGKRRHQHRTGWRQRHRRQRLDGKAAHLGHRRSVSLVVRRVSIGRHSRSACPSEQHIRGRIRVRREWLDDCVHRRRDHRSRTAHRRGRGITGRDRYCTRHLQGSSPHRGRGRSRARSQCHRRRWRFHVQYRPRQPQVSQWCDERHQGQDRQRHRRDILAVGCARSGLRPVQELRVQRPGEPRPRRQAGSLQTGCACEQCFDGRLSHPGRALRSGNPCRHQRRSPVSWRHCPRPRRGWRGSRHEPDGRAGTLLKHHSREHILAERRSDRTRDRRHTGGRRRAC